MKYSPTVLDRVSEPPTVKTNSGSISKKALTYFFLLAIGAGLGAGGAFFLKPNRLLTKLFPDRLENPLASPSSSPQATLPAAGGNSNFVTEVVKGVGPAVVRINASRTVATQTPEIFQDPFFRHFFGDRMPHFSDKQVQRGTGSGFIVSDRGQILTNAHVVDGADSVTVTLKDGRTFKGKVMGTDPLTDVAVIQIDAENLPVVKLGDSNDLQVGEWAIAIGNPLGLDNTVTTGIVSATGRSSSEIGVADKQVDFIQTDAAINPGNSGGPLLNAKGEVIGMNTAIIQNAQGIGFAIPINRASSIAEQLIAKGKVDHSYLGIQMTALSPETRERLQSEAGISFKQDRGIAIVKVVPNSPADRAGLKAGDILTAVAGQEVKTPTEVQKAVAQTEVGRELPLSLDRDGQAIELVVKVGVLPTSPPQ